MHHFCTAPHQICNSQAVLAQTRFCLVPYFAVWRSDKQLFLCIIRLSALIRGCPIPDELFYGYSKDFYCQYRNFSACVLIWIFLLSFYVIDDIKWLVCTFWKCLIQTEASRRRREAEVQQTMENGLGSCMYICMFFTYISQFTAHTEFKSVPFASPLNATLLRNEFSWVRYPTSAWHVKIAKKVNEDPWMKKNHVKTGSRALSVLKISIAQLN